MTFTASKAQLDHCPIKAFYCLRNPFSPSSAAHPATPRHVFGRQYRQSLIFIKMRGAQINNRNFSSCWAMQAALDGSRSECTAAGAMDMHYGYGDIKASQDGKLPINSDRSWEFFFIIFLAHIPKCKATMKATICLDFTGGQTNFAGKSNKLI